MTQPPSSLTRPAFIEAVEHVIQARKTAKLLRDPDRCSEGSASLPADFRQQVAACVASAGWAPFHKIVDKEAHLQGDLTAIVPWRCYMLAKPMCCAAIAYLRQQAQEHPDSKWAKAWGSKIPRLLAGAGALVLVTWLPDPPANGMALELTDNNMEHIAAAAAAIQNLLLAAEARGMSTYWASGGILGDSAMFAWLGIPRNQKLLGAIFLSPADWPHDAQEPGALRDKRGAVADWALWIDRAPDTE